MWNGVNAAGKMLLGHLLCNTLEFSPVACFQSNKKVYALLSLFKTIPIGQCALQIFCDWELSYFVSVFYFLPMLYFLLISNSPQITFTSILVSQEMEFFESP